MYLLTVDHYLNGKDGHAEMFCGSLRQIAEHIAAQWRLWVDRAGFIEIRDEEARREKRGQRKSALTRDDLTGVYLQLYELIPGGAPRHILRAYNSSGRIAAQLRDDDTEEDMMALVAALAPTFKALGWQQENSWHIGLGKLQPTSPSGSFLMNDWYEGDEMIRRYREHKANGAKFRE